jgi:transposase
MDMWAAYAKLVPAHAPNAQLLFDRFHIVKQLNEAVDAARRELWRRPTAQERATFKGTRWLLLKNPWNLKDRQKATLHAGPLEHTLGARLVFEGSLPIG